MKKRRRERGQGLLTALLVLLLVSTAVGLLAAALHRQTRLVRQEAAAFELRTLGDAALAEALAELSLDRNFPGALEHDFAGGKIASEVTPVSTHRYILRATARRGSRTRIVDADVRRIDGKLRVVAWRRLTGEAKAR